MCDTLKKPGKKGAKKVLINLSNLFPSGTHPQLKQIQSTLNIAGYIVLMYRSFRFYLGPPQNVLRYQIHSTSDLR